MKLPFLKLKSKKDFRAGYILALDVGTAFVKTVLFRIEKGEILLEGYGKVAQQVNSMKGAMIVDLPSVIETCDLSIGKALKDFEGDLPEYVILGIAGELVQGITIMANYERENKDEKVDKDELSAVVSRVREHAFQDAIAEVAEETGLVEDQIQEISSTINDTFIDNFRVQNPIGFQGKDVTFRVFSTFAPSIHVNSLKSIAEELDLKIIDVIVEPYAITRAFTGARKDNFDGIFIDVGGGTTDVAVVYNGGIIGTKMFAFGGNLYTKRIEKLLNLSFEEAEVLKIQYSRGEIEGAQLKKIQDAYYQDAKVWVDGIELALKAFEDVKTYPTNIYLCGGGCLLPEIKTALQEHPWLQRLRFQKFPDVKFVTPDDLENVVDEKSFIKESSDITPAALAHMTLELDINE